MQQINFNHVVLGVLGVSYAMGVIIRLVCCDYVWREHMKDKGYSIEAMGVYAALSAMLWPLFMLRFIRFLSTSASRGVRDLWRLQFPRKSVLPKASVKS